VSETVIRNVHCWVCQRTVFGKLKYCPSERSIRKDIHCNFGIPLQKWLWIQTVVWSIGKGVRRVYIYDNSVIE
jgi:hypothetical protein